MASTKKGSDYMIEDTMKKIKEREKRWKYKIAVLSGKGGVGKTTVAVNLATALAKRGYSVGLLDADVHGPDISKMLGIENKNIMIEEKEIIPYFVDFGGKIPAIKVMTFGSLVEEEQPIVWRGPLITKAIWQLLRDVRWGDLDFFIVDFPPGTGDEILTIIQSINIDAAIVVTTPQNVALFDTRKAATMMKESGIPYIGIVENMSYLICPHCGKKIDIFGEGGGKRLAEEVGADFLGEIPIDLKAREMADKGISAILHEGGILADAIEGIAGAIVEQMKRVKKP
ncbi:MAG: Mrp/NBP35 family ATP-binding protein [Candidatus Diapherotrites archaeon]|nr:Mrp/NBP35 family ATP-binding protein [Candidatus Diapherotrites archaeon]